MITMVKYPDVLEKISICLEMINKYRPPEVARWEINFLKNIKKQTEDNIELSESQKWKLDNLIKTIFKHERRRI